MRTFNPKMTLRHFVRVYKEMDSKSIGLCPQGLESLRCRFPSRILPSRNLFFDRLRNLRHTPEPSFLPSKQKNTSFCYSCASHQLPMPSFSRAPGAVAPHPHMSPRLNFHWFFCLNHVLRRPPETFFLCLAEELPILSFSCLQTVSSTTFYLPVQVTNESLDHA